MAASTLGPRLGSELLLLLVALYTLITASGRAIDALLALARRYNVPELVIGSTILALGTSLPELGAHLTASVGIITGVLDYRVTSAVVLGGNMGSSTAQQLLLFGILLLGIGQIDLSGRTMRDSILPMGAGLVLTLGLAWDGTISRLDGVVLLAAFGGYLAVSLRRRQQAVYQESVSTDALAEGVTALLTLTLVLASASVLLTVIQDIVARVLLGGSMIGVLTLGIASSFPELSTVLNATRRKAPLLAVGTLVGSNIVNPLVGFGLGGLVSTYHVPPPVRLWDLPFKIAAVAGLALHIRYRDGILRRRAGIWLIGMYFVYLVGRLLLFPGQ
jgi:cation:H+ antiporter